MTSAVGKRNELGKGAAHTIELAGSLGYDITSWIRYIYCQREKITAIGCTAIGWAVKENHPITASGNRGLEGGSVRIWPHFHEPIRLDPRDPQGPALAALGRA